VRTLRKLFRQGLPHIFKDEETVQKYFKPQKAVGGPDPLAAFWKVLVYTIN
jgi:hypothetical protein